MKLPGWAALSLCLLLAIMGGGCACVDSCCTSSCDFAGCGCTQLCGSQSQPIVDSLGQMSLAMQSRGGCGGRCGAAGGCTGGCTAIGSGGGIGCAGWNRREHFVDSCGQPCYGPVATIAMMLRNSLMSCGCGQMYVDEWLSDPPLCTDPCGTGCSAAGECGPYVGGGCCGGCSAGMIPSESLEIVEGGCSGGCGCTTSGGCRASCGCGGSGLRVGEGRIIAGTATCVADKVETFLADRKYKWSQRGYARNCGAGTCGEYAHDIPDYRFDTPESLRVLPTGSSPCHCAKCATNSSQVARAKRATGNAPVKQVRHLEQSARESAQQVQAARFHR